MIRRALRSGDDDSPIPTWYAIIQTAKQYHISPYELEENCTAEWWHRMQASNDIDAWYQKYLQRNA